jgi:putative transposase
MFDAKWSGLFVDLLRRVEVFSGVEVLTYCVMSNHFHLLVRVPQRREVGDAELLARYEQVAGPTTFRQFKERWDRLLKQSGEAGPEVLRRKLKARMYDLSMFMKEMKQRFTQWYNWEEDRVGRGTFWTDRYKSVLVEGGWRTLATMAAYIDLNAVRAGMVANPKDHPWCGYAAAAVGDRRAREGLDKILGDRGFRYGNNTDVVKLYELILLGKTVSSTGKAGLSAAQLEELFGTEGMKAPWEICRERVRGFSDGVVIGTEGFVGRISRFHPDYVAGRPVLAHPPFG